MVDILVEGVRSKMFWSGGGSDYDIWLPLG